MISSPALIIDPIKVKANIKTAIEMIGDVDKLWPHIKTHKCIEVINFCQQAGIKHFKSATLSEAKLLGEACAKTVLWAYQPVGPNIERFFELKKAFPKTLFACLVDNASSIKELSKYVSKKATVCHIYIDVNVGQNRTGVAPDEFEKLYNCLDGLIYLGLHAYDGHIYQNDFLERKENADKAYQTAKNLTELTSSNTLIMSGSPTYSIHSKRQDVICSPGTFVYWDAGYAAYAEMQFKPAAKVLSRVISKPAENLICLDLGHKAIAAERPLDSRVIFEKYPLLKAISQSEEHLVMQNEGNYTLNIGEELIGTPFHICPTVALYHQAHVGTATWQIHRER